MQGECRRRWPTNQGAHKWGRCLAGRRCNLQPHPQAMHRRRGLAHSAAGGWSAGGRAARACAMTAAHPLPQPPPPPPAPATTPQGQPGRLALIATPPSTAVHRPRWPTNQVRTSGASAWLAGCAQAGLPPASPAGAAPTAYQGAAWLTVLLGAWLADRACAIAAAHPLPPTSRSPPPRVQAQPGLPTANRHGCLLACSPAVRTAVRPSPAQLVSGVRGQQAQLRAGSASAPWPISDCRQTFVRR